MPKVGPSKKPLINAVPLPKYRTIPSPVMALDEDREALLNLQTCTCDHDRCVHSRFVGEGEQRRLIVDVPCVGHCLVEGCRCVGFVFSNHTSVDGKKRRTQEVKQYKIVPPAAK